MKRLYIASLAAAAALSLGGCLEKAKPVVSPILDVVFNLLPENIQKGAENACGVLPDPNAVLGLIEFWSGKVVPGGDVAVQIISEICAAAEVPRSASLRSGSQVSILPVTIHGVVIRGTVTKPELFRAWRGR